VVGDFNSDGKPDLAVADGTSGLGILFGNGDGTFQAVGDTTLGATTALGLAVGDFNGDGKTDVALVTSTNTLMVMLGDGLGAFSASSGSPIAVGTATAHPCGR